MRREIWPYTYDRVFYSSLMCALEIQQKRKRELEKEQHRIVDGMGMSF